MIQDIMDLWDTLRDLDEQMVDLWLIINDFNTILDATDRVHGSEV